MIALAVVGALLVASINAYTTTLKTTSEIQQLKNLLNVVAAKGMELLTIAASTNSSTQVFLQLPTTIGYRQYWMRAGNDSSTAWIEGNLGQITDIEAPNRILLPQGTSACGSFVGGYGQAVLKSYMNGSIPQLNIASLGG